MNTAGRVVRAQARVWSAIHSRPELRAWDGCSRRAARYGELSALIVWPVLENEQMLARLDESQLATGQVFDRRGVAAEPPGFLAQLFVLAPGAADRLLESLELLALLDRFEQPLLPDERIDEHDAADQHQRVFDRSSSAAA